jgi:hypothetical protein
MCCLAYELAQYRDSAQRLPPVGTVFRTGQGPMTVTRTDVFHEAVWVRDDEGAEHRIAYDEMPPGPYKQCGDCNCGKKGGGGSSPSSGPGAGPEPEGGPAGGGNGDLPDSL